MYRRAFTLMELITTIAVMAVIAALSVPSFVKIIDKNKLNQVTMDFVERLTQTRSTAIIQKKTITMKIGDPSGWIPENNDVIWHDSQKPSGDISFDFMGRSSITEEFECYILQNKQDININKIIIIQKNGAINLEKNSTNCPTSLGGGA